MLPTLREDRRKTYSPVLPVSPSTGRVLQVPVDVIDAEAGLIAFDDEDGLRVQQSAFGGAAKLQWKVDWAARWVALGVDQGLLLRQVETGGESKIMSRCDEPQGIALQLQAVAYHRDFGVEFPQCEIVRHELRRQYETRVFEIRFCLLR